jgi:hypothetical protein
MNGSTGYSSRMLIEVFPLCRLVSADSLVITEMYLDKL